MRSNSRVGLSGIRHDNRPICAQKWLVLRCSERVFRGPQLTDVVRVLLDAIVEGLRRSPEIHVPKLPLVVKFSV